MSGRCQRSAVQPPASLANLGQRFGQSAVDEVNGIEALCGNNPADPPEGDSTSCTSQIEKSGYIVRVYAHMHLLGRSFKMVLNPGRRRQRPSSTCPTSISTTRSRKPQTAPFPLPLVNRCRSRAPMIRRWRRSCRSCASARTPLRHLGRRVNRRDVHRSRVDVGRPAQPTRQPLTACCRLSAAVPAPQCWGEPEERVVPA